MRLNEQQRLITATIFDLIDDIADEDYRTSLANLLDHPDSLQVYKRSIFSRLTRCLRDVYPVCEQLVGEPCFANMAWAYIKESPCREYDLNDFGDQFAAWIEMVSSLGEVPYLADIARLEWLWHRSMWVDPSPNLALHQLAGIPKVKQGSIQFRLPKASGFVQSRFPLLDIWAYHQAPNAVDSQLEIRASRHAYHYFVWHSSDGPHIANLDKHCFWLLKKIESGHSLGSITTQAMANHINVTDALAHCLTSGYISAWQCRSDDNSKCVV